MGSALKSYPALFLLLYSVIVPLVENTINMILTANALPPGVFKERPYSFLKGQHSLGTPLGLRLFITYRSDSLRACSSPTALIAYALVCSLKSNTGRLKLTSTRETSVSVLEDMRVSKLQRTFPSKLRPFEDDNTARLVGVSPVTRLDGLVKACLGPRRVRARVKYFMARVRAPRPPPAPSLRARPLPPLRRSL
ncbi:hypothetical protein EVAR_66879_1 [Eumeta japonica]|uniref:Uncharacterized protein n=1 Tax=Eumeta variegata TaxID=151549 RepID=A0A4C1ZYU9_EUMVA|nr:hypothetical protein EVAR_66879_1 [Eumeta japonica]